jgi:hypothetical protein
MGKFCKGALPLSALAAAMVLSVHAKGQAADATATSSSAKTLDVQIVLPPVYEATMSSLGALATSGAGAVKTYRSDARDIVIRAALSNALLAAGQTVTTINLDRANKDPSLGEIAILCIPRQNYVVNSVSLNYLNTLVQNINAVSTPVAAPTDIASALKLLFASSGYAIADKVKVDEPSLATLGATALASCKADLMAYAQYYYGTAMPTAPHPAVEAPAAAVVSSVDTFAFLGPIGTLVDTFLSILQPILIDSSKIVDQARRQQAIQTALDQNEDKITETGKQLASAIDNYSAASRQRLVGAFVEQLVSIREMSIDLNSVADCKGIAPASRLPSGAPDPAFIGCWSAAWAKLQPEANNLKTIADNYDALADAGNINANKLFSTIMANYKAIKDGRIPISDVVLNEMTEFITFANDIARTASNSNVATMKAPFAATSK